MDKIREILAPRSVRARDRLPLRRGHRRAAAAGPHPVMLCWSDADGRLEGGYREDAAVLPGPARPRSGQSARDVAAGIRFDHAECVPSVVAFEDDCEACVAHLQCRSRTKLTFGTLVRVADSWRKLSFAEFELRQLAASRKDLSREYEVQSLRWHRHPKPRVSQKICGIIHLEVVIKR
jgi:hypothetical protein